MTTRPTAILKLRPPSTRVLVRLGDHAVLKASLPPALRSPHPRALTTLLEAVALWHQAPVRVVVAAADLATWYSHGLVDALWVSADSLHYTVEVRYPDVDHRQRSAGHDLSGDLRQLALGGAR